MNTRTGTQAYCLCTMKCKIRKCLVSMSQGFASSFYTDNPTNSEVLPSPPQTSLLHSSGSGSLTYSRTSESSLKGGSVIRGHHYPSNAVYPLLLSGCKKKTCLYCHRRASTVARRCRQVKLRQQGKTPFSICSVYEGYTTGSRKRDALARQQPGKNAQT